MAGNIRNSPEAPQAARGLSLLQRNILPAKGMSQDAPGRLVAAGAASKSDPGAAGDAGTLKSGYQEAAGRCMLRQLLNGMVYVRSLLLSILTCVFFALTSMMLAAWLGANWQVLIGAGVTGLVAGAAVSRRLWFEGSPVCEETVEGTIQEWHFPGVQDRFERLLARQRVVAFLLIAMLLVVIAIRFAVMWQWPIPGGVSVGRLLAGVLVATGGLLAIGILNWRCPNCGRNLGRTLSIRQCPHCGIVLRG